MYSTIVLNVRIMKVVDCKITKFSLHFTQL